jgi:hypothetical protein
MPTQFSLSFGVQEVEVAIPGVQQVLEQAVARVEQQL